MFAQSVLRVGSCVVAIDKFTAHNASAFCLTHMHTDHTQGLRDSFEGRIYCSETTKTLLQHKWPALSGSVIPLPINETVSVKLKGHAVFSITTFDANHCPGSVIFLFESTSGRVLHTGDFRLGAAEQRAIMQRPAMLFAPINLVVLDNTYCNPRFEFPCRQSVTANVIDIIRQHSNMHILIGIDLVGKEELLIAIAQASGEKIWVDKGRLTTIVAAGFDIRHFTTDITSTRISALPNWMVCRKAVAKLNRRKPILGIQLSDNSTVTCPTRQIPLSFKTTAQVAKVGPSLIAPSQTQRRCALTLTSEGPQYPQTASELPADSLQFYVTFLHSAKDFRAALDRSPAITPWEHDQAQQLTKSLPYSDHSSFSELESFVSQLRPQAILPVVKPPHNQGYCTDPQVQFRHLLSPPDAGRQSWLPASTRVSTASEGHAPLCWQEIYQQYKSCIRRSRFQTSSRTRKPCSIIASPLGSVSNPIILDASDSES